MKKTWLLALGFALLAFVLRVYRLDFVSLRGDEAFTVVFVQRTWDGLWKGIRTVEPNPPLMYLVLRVWIALAGASEFATRYFSAFFGVLCVPLLYRLAREMFSSLPGPLAFAQPFSTSSARGRALSVPLIAAALIAINPYQIWHSQDVRNYTLWPALSLLGLIFFWRWWKAERGETPDPRPQSLVTSAAVVNLSCYVLAALASLYTHYYDVFILAALNILVFVFVLSERRWKTLVRWIAAQVVLVAGYAPWVLFGTNRVTTYGEGSAEGGVALLDQFSRTLSSFVLGDTVPSEFKSILWVPLALALAAALVYLARRDRGRAAFLTLYVVVPTLALYLISIGRPLFLERYLNGVAPAYYLTLAVGLVPMANYAPQLSHARVRLVPFGLALVFFAGIAAFALSNYYFDPAYAKSPDWRALAQFINARQQPGDIVVQNFTEMSPIYYENGRLNVLTVPRDFWAGPLDEKTMEQLNQEYRRVWFIPSAPDSWDPTRFVQNYLARYDDRVFDTLVANFNPQLYLTPREFTPQIIPVDATIGSARLVGYRVQGFDPGALKIRSAIGLPIVLYWRADRPIGQDYTVYVHLIDATGRVVAQHDGVPADGTFPTSQWSTSDLVVDKHTVLVAAAPGTYSLVVGMYDGATLVRVPASAGDANGVPLTQVVVTP